MTYRVFKKPGERPPPDPRPASFGRREQLDEPTSPISGATILKATALTAGCAFLAFEIVQLL